jgi:hypothetical protein
MTTKQAPEGRFYTGTRDPLEGGPAPVYSVDEWPGGARRKALNPRHDLRNHSPDGFQWGYGGSGPAQLALALVADATGDDALAQRVYQTFKFNVVATLPAKWTLTAEAVRAAVEKIAADRQEA